MCVFECVCFVCMGFTARRGCIHEPIKNRSRCLRACVCVYVCVCVFMCVHVLHQGCGPCAVNVFSECVMRAHVQLLHTDVITSDRT